MQRKWGSQIITGSASYCHDVFDKKFYVWLTVSSKLTFFQQKQYDICCEKLQLIKISPKRRSILQIVESHEKTK